MSGSGGGRNDGYTGATPTPANAPPKAGGGGGGGPDASDPCDIVQQAPLNSPQPSIVQGLNVGDVLDVVLNTSGVRPVLEVHHASQLAGSLTHRGHIAIINCIQASNVYQAIVTQKQGGAVELRVERV